MRLPALIGLALLALSGAVLADCIEKAAATFGTNPDVLRAIAIVESKVRPQAVNVNPNGSVEAGNITTKPWGSNPLGPTSKRKLYGKA